MADDEFGPIDFVVVEFPGGNVVDGGFAVLLDLVDRGLVRVLDLEFVAKDGDGTVRTVDVGDLGHPALAEFAGSSAGLLDADDLAQVAGDMAAGSVAAILVYEELSMLAVLRAWEAGGAHELSAGTLTPTDLEAALDQTDPS